MSFGVIVFVIFFNFHNFFCESFLFFYFKRYDDISPIALCLLQSSQSADTNGVIAGMSPEVTYPMDYCFLWFSGLLKFWQSSPIVKCSKDPISKYSTLSSTLLPRAIKCMNYLISPNCFVKNKGFILPTMYSIVIDWGYQDNGAFPINMALNAMFLRALDSFIKWLTILGETSSLIQTYESVRTTQLTLLCNYLHLPTKHNITMNSTAVPKVENIDIKIIRKEDQHILQTEASARINTLEFHAAALLLYSGLFDDDTNSIILNARLEVISLIKNSLNQMFPINENATRLSNPSVKSLTGFYTPYFQTFTFDGLFRFNECDFILQQMKQAWGWSMKQSNSTWLEVFDNRWEAVHSWSGCPTWQLTKYLLGLTPRFDIGTRHFEIDLHLGAVEQSCNGTIPSRDGDAIIIKWIRKGTIIHYTLELSEASFFFGLPSK